jgi:hypothetical protein
MCQDHAITMYIGTINSIVPFWTGVTVTCQGKEQIFKAICLIGTADLPGKSALQAFTQFNGKHGCSFCELEGEVIAVGSGHSRVYPFKPGPPNDLRTKESTFEYGTEAQESGYPVCFVSLLIKLTFINVKYNNYNYNNV